MFKTTSRSSVATLTNAIQSMPYAPSSDVIDERVKNEGDIPVTPTKRVLAEIQKRHYTKINAGWITLEEIKNYTGLDQPEVILALRELFLHQKIETVLGNGQGNHRYKVTSSGLENFAENQKLNHIHFLKTAVENEPKIQNKKAEDLILGSSVEPSQKVSLKEKESLKSENPKKHGKKNEKKESQNAPLRDARGHFLPKKKPDVVLDVEQVKKDAPKTFAHEEAEKPNPKSPILSQENPLKSIHAQDGKMVIRLDRRPGSAVFTMTIEDAIAIGQKAVNELLRKN